MIQPCVGCDKPMHVKAGDKRVLCDECAKALETLDRRENIKF